MDEHRRLWEREIAHPRAYAFLGHLEYERGRLLEAFRCFEKAIALEPNDSDVLVMTTFTLQGAARTSPRRRWH